MVLGFFIAATGGKVRRLCVDASAAEASARRRVGRWGVRASWFDGLAVICSTSFETGGSAGLEEEGVSIRKKDTGAHCQPGVIVSNRVHVVK